jgi:Chlorite dismutase
MGSFLFLVDLKMASSSFGTWLNFCVILSAKATFTPMNTNPRLHTFIGGQTGPWIISEQRVILGEALPTAMRLDYLPTNITELPAGASWLLHGATSNERYVTRPEKEQLLAKQPTLGRPEANCAVLIPIKKSAAWWALTQDERRAIFEERSHHNQIGMDYLPAIARRLHHCRDLSVTEPFDFLTWFEFAEADTVHFDQLLSRLRSSEEWQYIEREVEIRVRRVED